MSLPMGIGKNVPYNIQTKRIIWTELADNKLKQKSSKIKKLFIKKLNRGKYDENMVMKSRLATISNDQQWIV